ncbi:S9 family peptidase, partial [Halobacteriales archaeon QH_10_67_13]
MDPLESEAFYDLSTPTELAVSPDGERIAVVVDEFDPENDERRSSVFVVPADGSRPPHRLTRASDASQPAWSPDGSQLGFIGARNRDVDRRVGRTGDDTDEAEESEASDEDGTSADGGGDETDDGEPKPQVWMFDIERGGDAVQITDREEGVREFDWGPAGERIVVAARDPTEEQSETLEERRAGGPIEIERLQHKADGAGWLDDVTTYLFVVDVATGQSHRLDEAYGQGAREPLIGLQPAWGPGDRIAFASTRTDRPDDSGVSDLYTIAPDGSDLRRVTDSQYRTSGYAWGPDGERVAFVAGDPENWYKPSELRVAEPAAGEHWSVTASLDRTIALAGTPTWLDRETVLAPIGDEGLTRLIQAAPDRDAPARTFEAQGRDRTLLAVDAGGGRIGTILSEPSAGRNVFAADGAELDADAAPTRLTALNDELLAGCEMECRRVSYENDDGERIEAIVYLPPEFDPDDEPRPAIAAIHGGPMSYDAPEFRFSHAYWTSRGYVIYRPNYRGSTSYGRAFAESLKGTRGDLEADDVVAGLQALADRGWVDPDRSLVTGFSYGGITTANV